ncbi:endo alpha-1,4 polygalactosaminidase [Virgisporangium aurantiacum]|uniref:Endo alpha-1,4 polygalactosaminidase n=1 Tax=Virgisporangium aurantiacum TaxID=175570 RepID=A0A8J3Z485_9ACTN|nr:endo alpha-1,4 polygalactosaminidase [Virgisporangium aurantiacum]GIJ57241.1 endo alpha-1,4 polygalactosaminidase [Virgisporangium aurantiacum]
MRPHHHARKLLAAGVALVATATLLGPVPAGAGDVRAAAVWQPTPGTTWQWEIVGQVREPFLDVTMYDIDLTDAVPATTVVPVPGFGSVTWPAGENAGIVDRLHAAGKVVVCYLDTGAWESYEPDAALFPGTPGWRSGDPATDVILRTTGWDEEYWLDIRRSQWGRFAPILWARFDLAKSIGCDGVEPDQNNPYGNNPGPQIPLADEKAWYLEVAAQAHARGLSVGMKNGVEVTDDDTAAAFDWNLNEECFFYEECDDLNAFGDAGKAVFQTEYTVDWVERNPAYANPATLAASGEFCADARRRGYSTLVKNEVPDAVFVTC